MNRQDFEALTFEEQLNYVNARSAKTMKEIGKEIGIPPTTLSNIFSKAGYQRVNGKYVTKDPNSITSANPLQEILQHKDQIIAMVLGHQLQNQNLDFSPLQAYRKEDGRENISFEIPKLLAQQLNETIEKRGYKKQSLLCLLIYQFLAKNE